ncbi:hypothetical protein Pjdr2_2054 [Paenibacillus sp. JDR-2]|nr:hypothetical protein Pjdr2_2054 [Paenibacillus sp. JDR-2]
MYYSFGHYLFTSSDLIFFFMLFAIGFFTLYLLTRHREAAVSKFLFSNKGLFYWLFFTITFIYPLYIIGHAKTTIVKFSVYILLADIYFIQLFYLIRYKRNQKITILHYALQILLLFGLVSLIYLYFHRW